MLGLWLLGLYAFIAILSWVIICVLCYKPIGIPTYYDQHGEYRLKQYEKSERWRQAASLGASIVAAVGIPITSAICTKAAAVYCQRRSDNKAPPLTLRQMLALADKGWNDSAVLKDLITPTTCHRVRSALLLLSIFFVVIGKSSLSYLDAVEPTSAPHHRGPRKPWPVSISGSSHDNACYNALRL